MRTEKVDREFFVIAQPSFFFFVVLSAKLMKEQNQILTGLGIFEFDILFFSKLHKFYLFLNLASC